MQKCKPVAERRMKRGSLGRFRPSLRVEEPLFRPIRGLKSKATVMASLRDACGRVTT